MRYAAALLALLAALAVAAPAATPAPSPTRIDAGQLAAFLDDLGGINHARPVVTDTGQAVTGAYVNDDLEAVVLSTRPTGRQAPDGVLLPPWVQPRQLAHLAYNAGPKWRDPKALVRAVAVCLAESQGAAGSYNENIRDGVVVSRDVGLWQVNIPASAIGTRTEAALYDPAANAAAAYKLYDGRGFQPWVAYNTGVYLHAGYVARAVLGVANFLEAELVRDALDAGQTTQLRVPFVTIRQLRLLYPDVRGLG